MESTKNEHTLHDPQPRPEVTAHSKLDAITRELVRLNDERHKAGMPPMSYGKFMLMLEKGIETR